MSSAFEKKSLLDRHRLVNATVDHELKNGVHALSIVSKTPQQWKSSSTVKASPACLGGMKREMEK